MKPCAKLLPLLLVVTGCAGTTPQWDDKFGDTVRQARAAQLVDPAAGSRKPVPGTLDGKAAAGAQRAYAESYGYALREARPAAVLLTPGTANGK